MARWYDEGLRFRCRQCGKCCGGAPGAVWVTLEEAAAIAGFLGMPPQEFGKRYLRLVDGSLALTEYPDYDCIFLKDGRCEIYPVRPAQCRLFPFWKELMAGRDRWLAGTAFCPGVGSGRLYTADEIDEILRTQR